MKKQLEKNLSDNIRLIAIDPATHSIAFSIMDRNEEKGKLVAAGKINLNKLSMSQKLHIVDAFISWIFLEYSPSILIVEQPIYIQNFQASRLLSYIVGYLWGRCVQEGMKVEDIGPMQWKSDLGYKKVLPSEKREWAKTMEEKEVRKKAEFERKNRIKQIIVEVIPEIHHINDYDIVDAIAIGYWGISTH